MRAYLDIETAFDDSISVIGIYRPDCGTIQLVGRGVRDVPLYTALDGVQTLVTFNGSSFDLPIIRKRLYADLKRDFEHCDLLHICRRRGLRGGLKLGGETDDFGPFRERGLELGVLPDSVEHLVRHYGTEAAGIYNLGGGDRRLLRRLLPPHPAIEAEVLHAVRRELAQTVEDVLVRRLHLYYEHPERGIPAAHRVAELMAREHAWDDRRVAVEAQRYEAFARR